MDAEKRTWLFQRLGRQAYDDFAILPRHLSVKFLGAHKHQSIGAFNSYCHVMSCSLQVVSGGGRLNAGSPILVCAQCFDATICTDCCSLWQLW